MRRILLPALLAIWMLVAWPHLSEQYSTTQRVRASLAPLSWEDRAAAIDRPAYQVARDLAQAVPPGGCVLVLAYTGPSYLRYYRSRLPYYLYPRRVRFSDRTDESGERCDHLAVFRDAPQNLAREPFHGHWDERQLGERTARMTKILGGEWVEVFR